jgi:hypothetical protein
MLSSINISIKSIKVDSLGALISGLCMLHCLATPISLLHQLVQQHVAILLQLGGNH